MDRDKRLEIIKTMEETGIPIRSLCLSGHRKYPLGSTDPKIRERGMDIMEKAIEFASDIGISIIMLAGYDVYYEDSSEITKQYFMENLKICVHMASAKGILMGFETMETEFMNTVEKSMYYVKQINSPYLKVYPDLGNITNAATTYGTNVLDDIESGNGHLIAMHLKETVPGKFREVPYGTGHVNFESGIKKAWELGVRRFVTEFWYKGSSEWEKDLVFANHMMSDILNRQK